MVKIGLLSDTHGWLDPRILDFFKECDEAWHCGDIGALAVTDELEARFTLRAVYGNVDGGVMRRIFPEFRRFTCEGVEVLMTHIGGYPGHYDRRVEAILRAEPPRLFLCGHSHIAKVQYDKELACLHINPGAAGRYGFHAACTAVRFAIDAGNIRELELLELKK
ncbi:MAG: metallophosphatase family protein [Odoribacteraceae bacterium]|jgi:putative phosphoesterase|nr:metallophosphatase family protein [Odoribacteraceae bacterium]